MNVFFPTVFTLLLILLFLPVPALAEDADAEASVATTSCVSCHSDNDMIGDPALVQIAGDFQNDVHATAGLSCHDCHGGNPDPEFAEDLFGAKDETYAENPYRGSPEAGDVPGFCGRCHSDAGYMKRFDPDARVDQELQYLSSHHGLALARGDTRVATCVECHGVHGIRTTVDPASPIHPTQLAETCNGCHGDPKVMAGTVLADGRDIPVDQYERWRQSVHAKALLDKGDLFAPTCNDCHGNHGAAPPGQASVALVCGQCHGREARLFRGSVKQEGFELHSELMLDAGDDGCAACHEDPDPAATVKGPDVLHGCVTCHNNHSVARPTVAMLGGLPATPCAFCHEGPGAIDEESPERADVLEHYENYRDTLLAQADSEGIEGKVRFDYLVDQALELPFHKLPKSTGEGVLRPEFARLWEKFRIGKSHTSFTDPRTGEQVHEALVDCDDCHSFEGTATVQAEHMRESMHELMVLSARAERTMLAAQRGGVEVREALLDLDQAVDSQIALEVLVHTFDTADDGEFAKQYATGVEHATAALVGAEAGLEELAFRHRGLMISLVVILWLLVALALKIRTLPEE